MKKKLLLLENDLVDKKATSRIVCNYWCLKSLISRLIGVRKVILVDAKLRSISPFTHRSIFIFGS